MKECETPERAYVVFCGLAARDGLIKSVGASVRAIPVATRVGVCFSRPRGPSVRDEPRTDPVFRGGNRAPTASPVREPRTDLGFRPKDRAPIVGACFCRCPRRISVPQTLTSRQSVRLSRGGRAGPPPVSSEHTSHTCLSSLFWQVDTYATEPYNF